jgi:predicted dithiol-disulfide oxidoreductase (DUF899 family)
MGMSFPNESDAYRTARDALLEEEAALRAQVERVAALRRALPVGGEVPEDYAFTAWQGGAPTTVRLSQLFEPGHDTLFLYAWMYSPDMAAPCPMCTPFLDGFDGEVPHVSRRLSVAVCARSPIERLREVAETRGWRHLRLVSCADNDFAQSYGSEMPNGAQVPLGHVFRRVDGRIHHHWSTELLHRPFETGAPRHVDGLWGLWNVLDLTPEGRGEHMPAIRYDAP